jgi:hypothetical protein
LALWTKGIPERYICSDSSLSLLTFPGKLSSSGIILAKKTMKGIVLHISAALTALAKFTFAVSLTAPGATGKFFQ